MAINNEARDLQWKKSVSVWTEAEKRNRVLNFSRLLRQIQLMMQKAQIIRIRSFSVWSQSSEVSHSVSGDDSASSLAIQDSFSRPRRPAVSSKKQFSKAAMTCRAVICDGEDIKN
jgi:hypothetical protein